MTQLCTKTTIRIAAALAVAVCIYIYATLDPAAHFFPKCIFKSITGFDCPGCGSQRAIHALLTGNIADAWHFNALLVASIPVIATLFAADAMKNRRPRLNNIVNSRTAILICFVVITAWWILRNTPLIAFIAP